MSIINNIVGKPILHQNIHDNMQKELFAYEFFLFVYFIHELTMTYSFDIHLEPQFLYDYKEQCSYELTYKRNEELSHQFFDLICNPEKFNVPKEFILDTPYISIAIKYMEKISSQWFPKKSAPIYLNNTLDWVEQFLYLIEEVEKIPYIRSCLLEQYLPNKLVYSNKTKL